MRQDLSTCLHERAGYVRCIAKCDDCNFIHTWLAGNRFYSAQEPLAGRIGADFLDMDIDSNAADFSKGIEEALNGGRIRWPLERATRRRGTVIQKGLQARVPAPP
jgi:hypothetical protein